MSETDTAKPAMRPHDQQRWTAPSLIPRGQGFDATVPQFYECSMGDPNYLEIWCYTDQVSYAPGDQVDFHISTTGASFSITVTRDGLKPCIVHESGDIPGAFHATPADFYARGCGWPVAASWKIPDDLPSGFHIITTRTVGDDGTIREHEHGFCVRPAKRSADLVMVVASSTWLAYSDWGGTNNYIGLCPETPNGFAPRLSIHKPWAKGFMYVPEGAPRKPHEDRPGPGAIPRYPPIEFAYTRGYSKYYASAGWGTFDRNFVVWAERQGLAFDMITQHDLHFRPEILDGYKCAVVVGHDEYWSWEMRDAIDSFVDSGGNFARFGGNFGWQIRLEDEGHTQVCYKESAPEMDPFVESGPRNKVSFLWDYVEVSERPGAQTAGVSATSGIYALVGHQAPRHAGGFTIYRPDHWAFEGTGLCYGDQLGDSARIFGYEVDGLDVEIRGGLPYPTGKDGALPNTEVLAMGLASMDERESETKGAVRFYGEISEGIARLRYGENPTEEELRWAANGNGVIVSVPRGRGQIFCAATCEWVNGLKLRDPFVERITQNVLERFCSD